MGKMVYLAKVCRLRMKCTLPYYFGIRTPTRQIARSLTRPDANMKFLLYLDCRNSMAWCVLPLRVIRRVVQARLLVLLTLLACRFSTVVVRPLLTLTCRVLLSRDRVLM